MAHRNLPRPAAVYGIDIGKNVFHVVGLSADGTPVQKVRFRRDTLLQFFARADPSIVGMESCAGSQWLARRIQALRHKVRLIPAQFVKPDVKSNKSDIIDAEAIAEATTRPTMTLRHGEGNRSGRPPGAAPDPRSDGRLEDALDQSDARLLPGIWRRFAAGSGVVQT